MGWITPEMYLRVTYWWSLGQHWRAGTGDDVILVLEHIFNSSICGFIQLG